MLLAVGVLTSLLLGATWASPLHQNEVCGRSKYWDAGWSESTAYIVGGNYARPNEFPWLVSLRWTGYNHLYAHTCNGALIAPDWVVTAAQCIYSTPLHSMVAILGQQNIYDTNESNPARQEIEIEDWFWHERVAMDNYYENDIGLIKLKRNADLNENVGLVCFPDEAYDYAGQMGAVAGWGEQTDMQGDYSEELKYIKSRVQTNEDCLARAYGYGVTENMVCAGEFDERWQAPCGGDNGSPMVVKRNGLWDLVGLSSWSNGCANGYPSVYVRVSKYLDWMRNIMDTYPNIPNYP